MTGIGQDLGLLLLRLSGLYLAFGHGWGKVSQLASGGGRFIDGVRAMGFPFPEAFAWAAAAAEFGGGLLVAFGLLTRISAALAAFTMFIAVFARHHAHLRLLSTLGMAGASTTDLEQWGNPELAVTYLLLLAGVVLLGPGRFSIDHLFWDRPGHGRRRR